jgi:phosphoglucosamine mutase
MLKLGWATGKVFAATDGSRPTVVIGKDTRVSGYMLESALQAGLVAAGANVKLLGPLPTPGIALLTRSQKADAGIVISASHNPYYDNGIKFFNGQGSKLSDEQELQIEAMIDSPMETVDSDQLGKASRIADAAGRYIEYCKSTFPDELSLKGLKLVIDCAHGATYNIAPGVFSELGADVTLMGAEPDGYNINKGCWFD